MSRLINLALAASAGSIGVIALQAAPAHGAASTQAELIGKLGYEGGAAKGGGFHPTSGSVIVDFDSVTPLSLEKQVGPSGHFEIPLPAGQYTVIGCGPSSGSGSNGQCSAPMNVTLASGEVDHIKLVWAYAP
jgi:hypothetical protein